jgi:outer membrane cobalamin receptor
MLLTKIINKKDCLCGYLRFPQINNAYRILIGSSHSLRLQLIICFALLRLISFAQTDTVTLQEIEVLGLKSVQNTLSASPVQQLSLKKIESLASTSVADAIKNFSGVVIKDFGGIGGLKTVMIRSMSASHTGIYIDGIPSSEIATGQADLGRLSLRDISKISLSIGQSNAGLKTARMYSSASVIEINTLTPDFTDKNKYFQIGVRAGSFGTLNPSFATHFKTNRLITSLRVDYSQANGKFPFEYWNGSILQREKRDNSDINTIGTSIKSSYTLKDSSALVLNASYTNSERGLPGAIIFYNPFSGQRLQNIDFVTALTFRNNPSKNLRLMTKAGYSNRNTIYIDPHWQNQTGVLKNEYRQEEYNISEGIEFPLSNPLIVSFASDLIYNRLETNAYSIESPERVTSLTVVSLRYNRNRTEIQGNALFTYASDRTDNSNNDFVRLSPEISILHAITPNKTLKVRALYKDIFRLPNFNELYYTISGNLDLKPENVTMFNLGIIYEKPINEKTGIHLRGDGFINLVTDKIVTVPTMNLFIWRTQNIEKATIKGFETFLSFSRKFSSEWSFELSGTYTFQDAQDISDPSNETYGDQLAYIPFETAGGLVTVSYKKLNFGINTLYNGYRYISNNNTTENLLNSWVTTDLTASTKISLKQNELVIKIELANIFDQKYEVMRGFPMMGRAFFLNLDLNL